MLGDSALGGLVKSSDPWEVNHNKSDKEKTSMVNLRDREDRIDRASDNLGA